MPEGKKRHLKCSGMENPLTFTSVEREARKAEGDPPFPAKHWGVRQAAGTGLCWVLGQLAWPAAPQGLLLEG